MNSVRSSASGVATRYTVLIDGGPGGYGVVFPDLPGCTAMGATVDAALVSAAEAAVAWARVSEAHGEPVPPPRDAGALLTDPDVAEALAEGAALASVAVIRSTGRQVKANLSLDAGVLTAIDAAARRTGRTRSAMVETLAQVGLPIVG